MATSRGWIRAKRCPPKPIPPVRTRRGRRTAAVTAGLAEIVSMPRQFHADRPFFCHPRQSLGHFALHRAHRAPLAAEGLRHARFSPAPGRRGPRLRRPGCGRRTPSRRGCRARFRRSGRGRCDSRYNKRAPTVQGEQRLHALMGDRAVGVVERGDLEPVAVEHQPGPAVGEVAGGFLLEALEKGVGRAELLVDHGGQASRGTLPRRRRQALPEEAVVPKLGGLVEQLGLAPLGRGPDHVAEAAAFQVRSATSRLFPST